MTNPVLLALGGAVVGLAGAAAVVRRSGGGRSPSEGRTLLPMLRASAFDLPGRPGAAVRIPSGYRADLPLDIALYLHGHNGCVETLVGSVRRPCHTGGPTRNPSKLAEQLDASGANAILVMPQLRFEEASGAAGRLAQPGGVTALLDEILALLTPTIGARRASDVRRVSLIGHSGGYYSMAAILRAGDLGDRVVEVAMLDALYGEAPTFERWLTRRHAVGGRFRYANLYTAGGGTATESRAQRGRLPGAAGDDVARLDPLDGYHVPLLLQRSNLDHGGTSRAYPRKLWSPWIFDAR